MIKNDKGTVLSSFLSQHFLHLRLAQPGQFGQGTTLFAELRQILNLPLRGYQQKTGRVASEMAFVKTLEPPCLCIANGKLNNRDDSQNSHLKVMRK